MSERKFSHGYDEGDQLADLLGRGDEWMTISELCGYAVKRIAELEAFKQAVAELRNDLQDRADQLPLTGKSFPAAKGSLLGVVDLLQALLEKTND